MARTANNTEKEDLLSKATLSHVKPKKVTPTRRSSVRIATKLSLQSDVSKARKKGKGPLKKRPIKLTVVPSPCSDASTPGLSAASTLHCLKQDGDKTSIKDELMKDTDEAHVSTEVDVRAIDNGSINKQNKEGKGATIDNSNSNQVAVPVNDSFWEIPAMISADDPSPSTPATMPLESTLSCFSGPFIQDMQQFQQQTGERFAGKQLFDGNQSDTPLPFNLSPDLFAI